MTTLTSRFRRMLSGASRPTPFSRLEGVPALTQPGAPAQRRPLRALPESSSRFEAALVLVPEGPVRLEPALRLARGLASSACAVHIEQEPSATAGVLRQWACRGEGTPLVVLERGLLPLALALLPYLDALASRSRQPRVAVVLPELEGAGAGAVLRSVTGTLLLRFALLGRRDVAVFRPRRSPRRLAGPPCLNLWDYREKSEQRTNVHEDAGLEGALPAYR